MDKLRKEFAKERKLFEEKMKDVVIERKKKTPVAIVEQQKQKKMIVDQKKLEETIKKACIPIPKKTIVVLDTVPVAKVSTVMAAAPVAVSICKAINLNGTPCKCRAKIGQFCAKHAP